MSTAISVATMATDRYVPRGRNELHTIFERHSAELCEHYEHYEEKYAATYGRYRLERIQQIGERFCTCGDYLQGVARIRCTNPECGHDYFRPFFRNSVRILDESAQESLAEYIARPPISPSTFRRNDYS